MDKNTRKKLLFILFAALLMLAACSPATQASPTAASSLTPTKTYIDARGEINTTVDGKKVNFRWSNGSGCGYTMRFGDYFPEWYNTSGSAEACTVEDMDKSLQEQKAIIDALPGKITEAITLLKSEMSSANSISEANQELDVQLEESVEGGSGRLRISGNSAFCQLTMTILFREYQLWGGFPCTQGNVENMLNGRFETAAPFGERRIDQADLPRWEQALVDKFIASFDSQTFWAKTNSDTSVEVEVDGWTVSLSLSLNPGGCESGLAFKFQGNTGSVHESSEGVCTDSGVYEALSRIESHIKPMPGTYSRAIDVILEEMANPSPLPTVTPDATYAPLLGATFFDFAFGAREIQRGDDVYIFTWETEWLRPSPKCLTQHYAGPKAKMVLIPVVVDGGCTKENVIGAAEEWKDTRPAEQQPTIEELIEEIRRLELFRATFFDPASGNREIRRGDDVYVFTWDTGPKCLTQHYAGPMTKMDLIPEVVDGGCTKENVIGAAEEWKDTLPAEQQPIIEELIEEIRRLE